MVKNNFCKKCNDYNVVMRANFRYSFDEKGNIDNVEQGDFLDYEDIAIFECECGKKYSVSGYQFKDEVKEKYLYIALNKLADNLLYENKIKDKKSFVSNVYYDLSDIHYFIDQYIEKEIDNQNK